MSDIIIYIFTHSVLWFLPHAVLPESTCPDGNACSQNCVILFGQAQCSCNPGYSLSENGVSCLGEHMQSIHPDGYYFLAIIFTNDYYIRDKDS